MVYFVRHGETDYNLQGLIQGQLDIPLNENGIKQAHELSKELKNYKIDIIFYSPLKRAKQTAEIININHNALIVSHGGVYKHIYRFVNKIKDITSNVVLPKNCSIYEL